MAGVFNLSQLFPQQSSMWEMTAAQRALLLSRTEEDEKRTELEKKMPERYSMERIKAIVAKYNNGLEDGTADPAPAIEGGESSPLPS